jgi:hypothetical protein
MPCQRDTAVIPSRVYPRQPRGGSEMPLAPRFPGGMRGKRRKAGRVGQGRHPPPGRGDVRARTGGCSVPDGSPRIHRPRQVERGERGERRGAPPRPRSPLPPGRGVHLLEGALVALAGLPARLDGAQVLSARDPVHQQLRDGVDRIAGDRRSPTPRGRVQVAPAQGRPRLSPLSPLSRRRTAAAQTAEESNRSAEGGNAIPGRLGGLRRGATRMRRRGWTAGVASLTLAT